MGFELTRFEEIPEDFLCPICQDALEDPIQIPTCEHIFCTFCITEWMDDSLSCPVDRMPIRAAQQLKKPSRFFLNQYNRLKIKCKFSLNGCEEIVEIDRLMNHESNCSFNPDLTVQCDRRCGAMLTRLERQTHNCVFHLRNLLTDLQGRVNTQNEEIGGLKQIIIKNEMASNACDELRNLIVSLKQKGKLKLPRVENVMLAVDRSIFCTLNSYTDSAMGINYGTTISAPSIHAIILELLNSKLTSNAKVLDIGSGSGYLTFCMALMVGSNGKVIGIDHIRELVVQSNNIREQHFSFLKNSQIRFVTAEGRNGYQSESPYDVINYGGAIDDVPQIVIDQLKPNGIIVVPLGPARNQTLTTISKSADGNIARKAHIAVNFAPIGDLESQLY